MTKIWPIAVNAFVQTIRQPIFSILVLLIIAMLAVITSVTAFSMQTDAEQGDTTLMVDSALATMMSFSLFLAVFSASAVLSREIESKTVLTVVTKPVPRSSILLGKLLGVAAAVTIGYYLASVALVFNARHGVMATGAAKFDTVVLTFGLGALLLSVVVAVFCNYFFSFNVCSSFILSSCVLFTMALIAIGSINSSWQATGHFLEGIEPQILTVLLLLWMATMVMTAMAVAVSTRLPNMATLGVCYAVFLLALMSENIFRTHSDTNILAKIAWLLMPNLTYLFALDTLTMHQAISARYVLLAGGYSLCYFVGLTLLAMGLFQTREMDSREDTVVAPMLVNFYAWAMRIAAAVAIIASLAIFGGINIGGNWPLATITIAAGIAVWTLAGYFGQGSAWALWLIVTLAVAQFIFSSIVGYTDLVAAISSNFRYALFVTGVTNFVYVVIMASRKTTRAHFSGSGS